MLSIALRLGLIRNDSPFWSVPFTAMFSLLYVKPLSLAELRFMNELTFVDRSVTSHLPFAASHVAFILTLGVSEEAVAVIAVESVLSPALRALYCGVKLNSSKPTSPFLFSPCLCKLFTDVPIVLTKISKLSRKGSNILFRKLRVPPMDPLRTSPTLIFLP